METLPVMTGPAIVPEILYRDVRASIAFLERAFGFVPGLSVPEDGDSEAVVHAELWAGDGCLMVATLHDRGPWRYRSPRELGGASTGSAYLATSDVDAMYDRARAAGAHIVRPLAPTGHGSREFSARDLEGHLWHVGTYRPRGGNDPTMAIAAPTELFAGAQYTDVRAATAWLGRAFGATPVLLVPDESDAVAYAQVRLGDAYFMLGCARDDDFQLKTPRQLDGDYTQTFNAYVADPDAHHARAAAAGASIVAPLADTPYGARAYAAADCDGYVWYFSTYRPTPPAG